MGKVLETLKQGEIKRGQPANHSSALRPYEPERDESTATETAEEISFIEVGGPQKLIEASADVLRSASVRAAKPPVCRPAEEIVTVHPSPLGAEGRGVRGHTSASANPSPPLPQEERGVERLQEVNFVTFVFPGTLSRNPKPA